MVCDNVHAAVDEDAISDLTWSVIPVEGRLCADSLLVPVRANLPLDLFSLILIGLGYLLEPQTDTAPPNPRAGVAFCLA